MFHVFFQRGTIQLCYTKQQSWKRDFTGEAEALEWTVPKRAVGAVPAYSQRLVRFLPLRSGLRRFDILIA